MLALALEYTSECSKDSIHSKYDHMLQKASIVEMSCSVQAASLATPHPGIAKVSFGLYKDLLTPTSVKLSNFASKESVTKRRSWFLRGAGVEKS